MILKAIVFGGNGTIGRLITRYMLERSWHVTCVVRDPRQSVEILQLGDGLESSPDVVVCDLLSLSETIAGEIFQRVKPDCVVFTASSSANYEAIDCNAAKMLIKVSAGHTSVRKFLVISFPASRRKRAPWWNDKEWADHRKEKRMFPVAAKMKVQTDEYLLSVANAKQAKGQHFQGISLRPTWFVSRPPTGKITLGHTTALGQIAPGDVALTAISLLSRNDTNGWFDINKGSKDIEEAVEEAVCKSLDASQGEELDRIYDLARDDV
ncbi:NAD(P)-binding protein [Aspergillus fijiensis CBS 313.89]|uniref:NAD(P)-binding protein n=1 Tax=Aspergillus fijiensis CBS 313.89 TaxID=1448319 RepID=A0A8G1RUN0_9EURO|nr:NAD(P)-binding protein [Aspergillus fijiensis CBS 313.89]RAK79865.1 NAD(P)-binding protein [Aspergillus fijiensis CBS 313.89]